jgi:ABC-2 type transport system permease protein
MPGLSTLTRTELKLFYREPSAYIWCVGFPILLLAILGAVPGFRKVVPELDGARLIDLYVPIIAVMTLAALALFATPSFLALYRDKGILRRMATTPVRPVTVLVAQLGVQLVTAVAVVVVLLGGGALVYDTPLPK